MEVYREADPGAQESLRLSTGSNWGARRPCGNRRSSRCPGELAFHGRCISDLHDCDCGLALLLHSGRASKVRPVRTDLAFPGGLLTRLYHSSAELSRMGREYQ